MADLSPEAQKVLDARTSAVEELKAIDQIARSIIHPDVIRLANARLFEAAITMRVIAGEPVSAAEIKAAAALVEDARGMVRAPIEVLVTFVPSTDAASADSAAVDGLKACRRCGWSPSDQDRVARCYRCGWREGDDTTAAWKPPADLAQPMPEPSGPVLDGEVLPPEPKASPPLAINGSASVRRGVSASAFHDQPSVPLKRLRASVDGDGKPIHNSGVGTLCW